MPEQFEKFFVSRLPLSLFLSARRASLCFGTRRSFNYSLLRQRADGTPESLLNVLVLPHASGSRRSSCYLDVLWVAAAQCAPAQGLAQFAKELKLVFPNSQRLNRGGLVVKDLVESARAHEYTDIVVVHEHRCVTAADVDTDSCATLRTARSKGLDAAN